MALTPAALAFERAVECEILAEQPFAHPMLDIGCGDGIFAHILFDEKIDVGIDPDLSEVEKSKTMSAYDELIVCYGDNIPKEDASFKTILSNSVLEHIDDLMPVLIEANRLLAPGGKFYITIPTDQLERNGLLARVLSGIGLNSFANKYAVFHNRFWRHFHAHSPKIWRDMFKEAGFTIVEERVYASKNFSTFYDTLVPLALPSFVAKTLTNRWFFFPKMRSMFSILVYVAIAGFQHQLKKGEGSSLVYYALTKS